MVYGTKPPEDTSWALITAVPHMNQLAQTQAHEEMSCCHMKKKKFIHLHMNKKSPYLKHQSPYLKIKFSLT